MTAYDDIVDLLVEVTPPERLASFRPSDATVARVRELLRRQRGPGLSAAEEGELDRFIDFDRIMTVARARARGPLTGARETAAAGTAAVETVSA